MKKMNIKKSISLITANDFDPQTEFVAAWAEQNTYYITESKITPHSYDYSEFMALK